VNLDLKDAHAAAAAKLSDFRTHTTALTFAVAIVLLRYFYPSSINVTVPGILIWAFMLFLLGALNASILGFWIGFDAAMGHRDKELIDNIDAIVDGVSPVLAFLLTAYLSPQNASYASATVLLLGGLALGLIATLINKIPAKPPNTDHK